MDTRKHDSRGNLSITQTPKYGHAIDISKPEPKALYA
jgi:hypothetical protein